MEKHSAMIEFLEQLKVTRMSKKEAKECDKGIETKQMLLALGLLALVEAYDELRAKHQEGK